MADPRPARILAIAGSDSSGGAGIQADIKTITMLGGYAMTAITAITAQNTTGVQAVQPLSPDLVRDQIASCVTDIGVDAIKIGMLGRVDLAKAVAEALRALATPVPVVFDPVLVATSGAALAEGEIVEAMLDLAGLASLTTPNLPELEALGGTEALLQSSRAILIKGGHGEGETITDRLVSPTGEIARWEGSRIDTRHTHGTGCTLSSAIATLLGQGLPLEDAISGAREFVRAALLAAPGYGAGHGPMGHQAVHQHFRS